MADDGGYVWKTAMDDRRRLHEGTVLVVVPPFVDVPPPAAPNFRCMVTCGRCGRGMTWRRTVARGEVFELRYVLGEFSLDAFGCRWCVRRRHAWAIGAAFAAALAWLVWWSLR